MKTSLPFVLLPACLALLGACSPTPSDRIAKNMQAYEQLPKEQQAKVARGGWKGHVPHGGPAGMGEPEQKMAGRMNGKSTERWLRGRPGLVRGLGEADSAAGIPG